MQRYDSFLTVISVSLLSFIIYFVSFSTWVYNQNFYDSLFEKTNVEINQAQDLTKDLFIYFRNNNYSVPTIKMLNVDENSHIRDVKIVINDVFKLFYFVITIFALTLFFVKKKQKVFFYGGILGIILPFILLIANFSFIFTIFHEIFFPQGNWIFPANSTLVATYTLDFFRLFALSIFLRGEMISVFVVFFSAVLRNRI